MKPELLSPAGSYDAALAAFQYGADAIYIGLPQFSARTEAENISMDELSLICAYAKTFSPAKKIYITFNTLLYDHELEDAFRILNQLEEFQPDGVIVQDLGAARMIRNHFPSLILHASTQMAAHNLNSVLALKELGFKRVVLARELSLAEIREIVNECDLEIEIFIHGALCYSYSGLCLFSAQTAGRSGNRGRCAYCCRHPFKNGTEQAYPFSMKDMALLPILDKVVSTGVHSLKIEGRMKSPLYVACVTSAYRRKLDGNLPKEEEQRVVEEIQTIFSRPWTQLYKESITQDASEIIDSGTIGHRGAPIGTATAVFLDENRSKRLRFTTTRALEKFDGLQIDIPGSARPFGFSIRNMRLAGEKHDRMTLPAGSDVEVEISSDNPPNIERGAVIYCSSSQQVQNNYKVSSLRSSELNTGISIDIKVDVVPEGITIKAESPVTGDRAEQRVESRLEPARNPEHSADAARKACSRLGETRWKLSSFSINDPDKLYVPSALFNQARRDLVNKLERCREQRYEQNFKDYYDELNGDIGNADKSAEPIFTLKIRLDESFADIKPVFEYSRIVAEIDHGVPEETLAAVQSLSALISSEQELVLSTPLITRARQRDTLRESIALLVQNGYTKWEVAELSGYSILQQAGITPCSADWTLYALNREASAELTRLGFRTYVTSPEKMLNSIYLPRDNNCTPEFLIYQYTPLYISATAPVISDTGTADSIELKGRGTLKCIVQKCGCEWVTTSQSPLDKTDNVEEALKMGIFQFRVDLSWKPADI